MCFFRFSDSKAHRAWSVSCFHGNWKSISRESWSEFHWESASVFTHENRGLKWRQRQMRMCLYVSGGAGWCDIYHSYRLSAKSVVGKREIKMMSKWFHMIKVKLSVCVQTIDHSLKQWVIKLLIELSQSPEEMKGTVAMTTSALKGSNHQPQNSIAHFLLFSRLYLWRSVWTDFDSIYTWLSSSKSDCTALCKWKPKHFHTPIICALPPNQHLLLFLSLTSSVSSIFLFTRYNLLSMKFNSIWYNFINL